MKIELSKEEVEVILIKGLKEKYQGIVPEGHTIDISLSYTGGAEMKILPEMVEVRV
jgi:hypothetical protein